MAQTSFTGTFTSGSAVVTCDPADDLSALAVPARVVLTGISQSLPAAKTTLPVQSFSKPAGQPWQINLAANFANVSIGPVAAKIHTSFTARGFPLYDATDTAHKALLNDTSDAAENMAAVIAPDYYTPEQFGAVGDALPDGTGTDDTEALQNAIDVAHYNGGGLVRYSKAHRLTSALILPDGVSIEATGGGQFYGKVSGNAEAVNVPVVSPFKGPVLIQTVAGEHGLNIAASGSSVNLRNVSIQFADPIKFTNTGHGVYCMPPIMAGDRRDSGIMGARWDQVSVYGHDGNHYAFWITNPLNCHFSHLTGWGGGGMCIETNGVLDVNHLLGNIVVEAAYFNLFLAGTSHAYYLKNTHGETILMTFIRPQCWVRDERASGITTSVPVGASSQGTMTTSGQHTFFVDQTANTGGTGASRWLTIIARDFESNIDGTGEIIPDSIGTCITPGLSNGAWGSYSYAVTDDYGFVMGKLQCKFGKFSSPGGEMSYNGILSVYGQNPGAGVLNVIATPTPLSDLFTVRKSDLSTPVRVDKNFSLVLSNDLQLDATASTLAGPLTIGFRNLNTGNGARLFFGDPVVAVQCASGGRLQMQSYWGIDVYGNRQNATPLALAANGGDGNDYSMFVHGALRADAIIPPVGDPHVNGSIYWDTSTNSFKRSTG